MRNQDIGAAQAYHEGTKLSYINLSNKPPLYKSYASLPVVPLPADYSLPEMSALDAVATRGQGRSTSLDLSALARLLHLSAGLIRKSATPLAGEVQYRAAPSAGALYPVEVYLVCGDIPGLEAGVYHFSPRDFALGQLRKGDYRDALSRISGDDKAIATAPATLVLTAIFWRSAWKYRSRGYRYCFWDCGTIVANLLATASASGLPAHVILGFVDDWVNHLLGLHDEREASLCLIPIGETNGRPSPSHSPDLKPLSVEPSDTLGEEGDYPEIRQMHLASSLATEEEAGDWRGTHPPRPFRVHCSLYPLRPIQEDGPEMQGLGQTILRRGSTRRFAREPIPLSQLGSILQRSAGGLVWDFSREGGGTLVDIYLIANAVDGLPSGSYFFSQERQGLELLREGKFRAEAGHLCFEQALGADASAVVFFMADLEWVMEGYGNRGYRAAQLESGILGGRIYLSAHALWLGATGLTFYDDDVAAFFAPHSEGKSAMFVVALGVTDSNNKVRPFRSRVGAVLDALARGSVKPGDEVPG